MLDRSKRIVLFSIWLDHAFTYTTRDFRHDNKYDARISRKEFNIEKKKKILETFRIFTRNFAPDFLERAKLSRRRRGRKGRDTRLDSSRSSARRSNNSDWNPRNRGSIERFSIKEGTKFRFIDGGGPRESRLHDTGLRYYTLMRAVLPRTRYVRMKDKRHLFPRHCLQSTHCTLLEKFPQLPPKRYSCRGNFR